ncbi:MAG TPA: 50S ribosomal protein L29 [Firmicutes bacterium]|nr:50S ribosomal protein L29 [Bacillota bacterium]
MKIKEVRELNEQELENRVKELKEELFNLRFQQATGQLENVMRIKEVRRSIARVKTVLRERALS